MSLRNENSHIEDLPPEYCHYCDSGCEFSETCLNCPLPVCVHDEPGGRRRYVKHNRAQGIFELHQQGKSIREIAVMFGVSTRTVQRALKSLRVEQQVPHCNKGKLENAKCQITLSRPI
jgi:hypothetical protein